MKQVTLETHSGHETKLKLKRVLCIYALCKYIDTFTNTNVHRI